MALIGPTGVGKTTTIAKLAATLKLRESHTVGLITIDTYRIAAVDQLKKYADILDIPLRVVGSPEELRAAIEAMSDREFILIDTAGRSPSDTLKLQELKNFLNIAGPDEVHLVLSSTATQESVMQTIWTADPRKLESHWGDMKLRIGPLFVPIPELLTLVLVARFKHSISFISTSSFSGNHTSS